MEKELLALAVWFKGGFIASLSAVVLTVDLSSTVLEVSGQVVVACISGFCLFKVAQLKSHINSRMDDLLALTAKAAYQDGKADGAIKGKADERADVKAHAEIPKP
jgi:hypothetical protein